VTFDPRFEWPRERLDREGPESLAVTELIALLVRTGGRGSTSIRVADALLERFGSLDALARAGNAELRGVQGMGPAKIARTPLVPGEKLQSPEQVSAHFSARMRRYRQEVFVVLLLDSRHRLIGEVEVSRGSLNQSLVHPREVFAPALRESAAAILVLHNHPSGDPQPSREDHEVTRRLVRAGEILGIRVVDHLVIGGEQFTSFARTGQLLASSD
jgi:DNA repair protein RadC